MRQIFLYFEIIAHNFIVTDDTQKASNFNENINFEEINFKNKI